MEWWQLGEIIKPHTTEKIQLRPGDLVYLFEHYDSLIEASDVILYTQGTLYNLSKEFSQQMKDFKNNSKKKVAIITQQRKFVVLARDSVREIDADKFEEKVLQHMPNTYEDTEEMEKLTVLMEFFYRCPNCYVDRYFSHLVKYTRTILRNLKNCSFEVLEQRRKWISALLESIRVFIDDRNFFRQTSQEVPLHQDPSHSAPHTLSQQAHASLQEILHILIDCLTKHSLFYFDLDHFQNLFQAGEFTKDLKPLWDKMAFVLWYRTSVDKGLKEALERFYKHFRNGDLVTQDEFVSFYTGTRSAICFDSFLQAINGASKHRCEIYVRTFTRYVYIEPALFVAYLNGLPEIVPSFEYWFDRIMKEKGIRETWKEAIDCPLIDKYLTYHYHYGNDATKSFYFFENAFASLTCRAFDENYGGRVDGLFRKLVALAPPTDFEAYDNIDRDARAVLAYSIFNEDSSPLLNENNDEWDVYLSNGTVIKLPENILKTWRTDNQVLKNTFVLLMKRKTTRLGYLMSHLIQRSEDHAKLFLEVLLHSKENCPQVWHTGVGWFVLFHCLQRCDGLKTLCGSEEYIGKLVTLFCAMMKTSLSCGTLYVYFHKLKSLRLSEDQIERIEKKLTERREVDDYFKIFADGGTAGTMNKRFFDYSKNYSYVFFAAFSNQFLRIMHKGDGNTLEFNVKVFRDCIHGSEELRSTFCEGWFKEQLTSRLRVGEGKTSYFPAMDHLKKLFRMTWAEYHAEEIVGRTIMNLYDKDSMALVRRRRTTSGNSNSQSKTFTSKFFQDFEPVKLLGHGGFGYVYKAKHRLDEGHYAVKRIAVADNDRAIEKVLREVKAMAKLDHRGIIRYYHTWIERPPPGWQEENDRDTLADLKIRSKTFDGEGIEKQRIAEASTQDISISPISIQQCSVDVPAMPEDSNDGSWLDSQPGNPNAVSSASGSDGSESDTESSDSEIQHHPHQGKIGKFTSKNSVEASDGIIFGHSESISKSKSSKSSEDLWNQSKVQQMVLVTSVDEELLLCRNTESFVYLYIQMQLCQEKTLHSWLKRHKKQEHRSLPVMKAWLAQLCSAVNYIHSQRMIHRDLKPQNIFFFDDNHQHLKVGDFGLITKGSSPEEKAEEYSSKDTHSSHTDNVGTRGYMSPEQIANQAYTLKIDVFSLGLIFCELVIPFQTFMERSRTLGSLQRGEVPYILKECGKDERKMVLWMTKMNPAERPPTDDVLSSEYLADVDEDFGAGSRRRYRSERNSSFDKKSSANF